MVSDEDRVRTDLAALLADWDDDDVDQAIAWQALKSSSSLLGSADFETAVDRLEVPDPDAVQGGPLE